MEIVSLESAIFKVKHYSLCLKMVNKYIKIFFIQYEMQIYKNMSDQTGQTCGLNWWNFGKTFRSNPNQTDLEVTWFPKYFLISRSLRRSLPDPITGPCIRDRSRSRPVKSKVDGHWHIVWPICQPSFTSELT